jgi:Domain of unknown function (DUF4352)
MRHNAARLGGLIGVGLAIVIGTLVLVGGRPPGPGRAPSIQSPSETDGDSRFARIGETVKLQGWEVTLLNFAAYQGAPSAPVLTFGAGGSLFAADVRVRNIQSRASEYSLSDFVAKARDGRTFAPSPETANIEGGMVASALVQSLETSEVRVIFDLPADAKDLVLQVLEVEFGIPAISSS